MNNTLKIKGDLYIKKEEELTVPKGLSDKNQIIWLNNKLREVIESNSFSKARVENFRKYTEALEQVVDYILGIEDYRKLNNESRRIVMFLLSTNKAWIFTPELMWKKKPKEVLKFINADLLPDFRKKIIIKFLNGQIEKKPFQDWEIKILNDETLNNLQVMYRIGRRYSEIVNYRRKKGGEQST